MEVRFSVGPSKPALLILEKELAGFRKNQFSFEFTAEAPELERCLAVAASLSGYVSFGAWVDFSKRELNAPRFLEMTAVQTVKMGKRDLARTRALPCNATIGPLRSWQGVVLSRHRLRSDGVSELGENCWAQSKVLGDEAARRVREAALTGAELRTVLDPEGQPLPGLTQWLPLAAAPRAEHNITTPINVDVMSDDSRHCYALPAYQPADLERLADVNERGQSWVRGWLVSQRARQALLAAKIRGLSFRPILEVGSPEYRQVIGAFERIIPLYLRCHRAKWILTVDPALKTDPRALAFEMAAEHPQLMDLLAERELSALLKPKP